MDFNNIMNLMGQQAKVLKELEDLIAHDEKEDVFGLGHSIPTENLKTLKTYVSTMKTAVDTATALAKHYKVAAATRTEQPAQEAKLEKEPAKKKGSTKKPDPPKEEPAKELPPEEEFDFLG